MLNQPQLYSVKIGRGTGARTLPSRFKRPVCHQQHLTPIENIVLSSPPYLLNIQRFYALWGRLYVNEKSPLVCTLVKEHIVMVCGYLNPDHILRLPKWAKIMPACSSYLLQNEKCFLLPSSFACEQAGMVWLLFSRGADYKVHVSPHTGH